MLPNRINGVKQNTTTDNNRKQPCHLPNNNYRDSVRFPVLLTNFKTRNLQLLTAYNDARAHAGDAMMSIEIPIVDDDSFDTTLEFSVVDRCPSLLC